MEILNITESTANKIAAGVMTEREARETLCTHGIFNYLPDSSEMYAYFDKYFIRTNKTNPLI